MHPGQPPRHPAPYAPRPGAGSAWGPPAGPAPAPQPRTRPRIRWVASPPPRTERPRRAVAFEEYTGPPFYPVPPRWGFPNLTWRWPTAVPGTPSAAPHPMQRLRLLARNALPVLWVIVVLAAIAALAEAWRYTLLVQSRDSALSTVVVTTSDALVLTAAPLTFLFALIAVPTTVWWLFVARIVAAKESGQDLPRPTWQVAVGVLVPVVNLVLAGSVVAELEHAVLRRPADRRPQPSRLVLGWWGAWIANAVLVLLVIVWRLREGVQAEADSVLLAALSDASAAALAAVTAVLLHRLTGLLAPISHVRPRPLRVLKVTGAPAPELRAHRPAGATR